MTEREASLTRRKKGDTVSDPKEFGFKFGSDGSEWLIYPVPGERVRRFAWWLKEFRWPGQRVIKSHSVRYKAVRFLLAITDDRAWTLAHQGRFTRWCRTRLGADRRRWYFGTRASRRNDECASSSAAVTGEDPS